MGSAANPWQSLPVPARRERTNFVRFAVGTDGQHHRRLPGVIREAYFLEPHLTADELDHLQDLYLWLLVNLPVPPFRRNSWPQHFVCWFRDDASDFISRMWDVVAIFREHGVPVRLLRSANPGKVVYEDAYQVVVAPWNRL